MTDTDLAALLLSRDAAIFLMGLCVGATLVILLSWQPFAAMWPR